jgi:zinc transporter 5/7
MDDYLNQQSKKYSLSYNEAIKYLSILLIAKFFKSFGIYLCYDLLKEIHLVQLLFFTLLIASIFYIILQKPFKNGETGQQQSQKNNSSSSSTNQFNKRLYRPQYLRIFKYSLVQTFIKLLFFFGLTQCGPLRTTLLFEQSEIAVLCALKAIFLSQTNPSRTRGVIVLLTAILILLAFDYDDLTQQASQASEHPEGRHHGIISHIFYFLISFFNVADHKAGVLLLVFALFLQIGFNQSNLSKFLITEVGGAKRLRALSTCFSALILSPWAIFNLFTSVLDPFGSSTDEISKNDLANHSWFYYLLPVLIMSLFLFVIDFYIESFVQQKTDSVYTSKFGSLFVFSSSLLLSFVWNHPHLVKVMVMDKIKTIIEQEHALSWGVIIAYVFFILCKFFLYILIENYY